MTDDEKQVLLANALGQSMWYWKATILRSMKATISQRCPGGQEWEEWKIASEQAEQYLQGFIDELMETRTETGDKS